MPAELVTAMLEYREKCIAVSGSDAGYQQILDSIQPAKTCVQNRLDMQQLQIDAIQLSSGPRKPFFDKYCPKFNESMSCFDDTLEGVAKCIGDDVDQVKRILKNMAYNLLDLACQNDGQLFIEAQKPEFKECISEMKAPGGLQCKMSDASKKIPISRYGEEQCRELDDALECIKKRVDECNAPKLFEVFQAIFNSITDANDCKQYTSLDEFSNNNVDGNLVNSDK